MGVRQGCRLTHLPLTASGTGPMSARSLPGLRLNSRVNETTSPATSSVDRRQSNTRYAVGRARCPRGGRNSDAAHRSDRRLSAIVLRIAIAGAGRPPAVQRSRGNLARRRLRVLVCAPGRPSARCLCGLSELVVAGRGGAGVGPAVWQLTRLSLRGDGGWCGRLDCV